MKLSEKLIIKEIVSNLAYVLPFEELSVSLTLCRPVFLTEDKLWQSDELYITDSVPSAFLTKPVPAGTVVLCKDPDFTRSHHGEGHVFLISENCFLPTLFNQLQRFFDRYDEWDTALMNLISRESGISGLLDASFSVFRNPLVLRSADYSMVAHSGIMDESPALSRLIDPVYTYETVTASNLDPLYNESLNYQEPFFLPEYLSGRRELCCNLFEHGIYSHRLTLIEEIKPVSEEEGPLLSHLASYIQLVMNHTDLNNAGETYPLEDLLCDIISQNLTDYASINTGLAEYGWFPSHNYCCMALKMSALEQQDLTSKYLCTHFEEIIPGSCAFRYDNELVVFVNLARYENTMDQLLNNIIVFLRDSFLKTGISNMIHGIMDLRYCYKQAQLALEVGSKYQPFRWIHKFEDISLQYFTECCMRELPTHMACSPKLLLLKEHDQAHKSDYYETLKVYLETHLNAVQASKKLFIHRSTFLYRLEKIQNLINIDFENPDALFYLMISYRILDLNRPEIKDVSTVV